MRIASLVPSATEMLFALGLGEEVVAVTHECDYPPGAIGKPHLTRSLIPTHTATTKTAAGPTATKTAAEPTAAEIDSEVRRLIGEGRHLYELDEPALAALDVDLVVTQAVCEVCAVSYDDVVAVAARLPTRPRVLSLDPSNLAQVIADVSRLGEATGVGDRAASLRAELEHRLIAVRGAVAGAPRPRVLALEWLDPPFIGGHWIPEMIEIAGGEDVLGAPGAKSPTADWAEIARSDPEVVVAMPCGWDAERARLEVESHSTEIVRLGAREVWAVDAAASFSRPGPRLIEGTELLAHLLHPDRVDAPAGVAFRPVLERVRSGADERS